MWPVLKTQKSDSGGIELYILRDTLPISQNTKIRFRRNRIWPIFYFIFILYTRGFCIPSQEIKIRFRRNRNHYFTPCSPRYVHLGTFSSRNVLSRYIYFFFSSFSPFTTFTTLSFFLLIIGMDRRYRDIYRYPVTTSVKMSLDTNIISLYNKTICYKGTSQDRVAKGSQRE